MKQGEEHMYQVMYRAFEHAMRHVGQHLIAHLVQHGPRLIENVTEKYNDRRRGGASSESKELSPEVRKLLDKYKAE
jgi:hypothetical protein